jgi:hypothetical protein
VGLGKGSGAVEDVVDGGDGDIDCLRNGVHGVALRLDVFRRQWRVNGIC